MNRRVAPGLFELTPHGGCGCILAEILGEGRDARCIRDSAQTANVGDRGFVLPYTENRKPGLNTGGSKRLRAREQFGAKIGGESTPVENSGRHGIRVSPPEEAPLERVRREVRLGRGFSSADFERALASFRELYNVAPAVVCCSPDVLDRYCALFSRSRDAARHIDIVHDGIPLVAAVLAPGTVAFEGDVDENRMGDW